MKHRPFQKRRHSARADGALRVALNGQLPPGGVAGGIEQFVIALVHALGKLDDGSEEYVIVGPATDPHWMGQYLGRRQFTVSPDVPARYPGRTRRVVGRARQLWTPDPLSVASDRLYLALGARVVHFPFQAFTQTGLPTIFNPHDLQHLHYPEFFSPADIANREQLYPRACREADLVAVESRWVKNDIIRQYGIDSEKIRVILWGAPTEAYEPLGEPDLDEVRRKFSLPERFALYPAQTWPHKNHIRLAEGLAAALRELERDFSIVCTGRQNDFWPSVEDASRRFGVENAMHFVGFVSPSHLRAMYRLAEFLILPSLFEGGGFPVLEAFREGTPVACSTATSLPEYAGDAAVLFDPTSPDELTATLVRMATDSALRDELSQRGSERIKHFTWDRAARSYRALYRLAANEPLSDADQELLASTL